MELAKSFETSSSANLSHTQWENPETKKYLSEHSGSLKTRQINSVFAYLPGIGMCLERECEYCVVLMVGAWHLCDNKEVDARLQLEDACRPWKKFYFTHFTLANKLKVRACGNIFIAEITKRV
jgi:hypothetical protein